MDRGELHLAEKLSRRARTEGAVNPRIWFDHGRILSACGLSVEAERAFHMALSLAPAFAEAAERLSALRTARGETPDPEPLQDPPEPRTPAPVFTDLTDAQDWSCVEAELTARGCAILPGLLRRDQAEELRVLFGQEEMFEQEIVHDDENGRGSLRFFTRPLPELVQRLRVEVYGRAALIANRWQHLLDRDALPPALDDFLEQCSRQGQQRSSTALAHYEVGGFKGLHRDTESRVIFPVQLSVTLGPGTAEDGGELILADLRPGKKVRQTTVPTDVGDGVLFCTRERLARIAGVPGLQPCRNALSAVRTRHRYILDVPFHDHG